MALTGTATPAVQADIRQSLGLRADAHVHAASHDRVNLTYAVHIKTNSMARHLTAALVGHESCIVYCPTRALAEEATATLRAAGVTAVDCYHAGLTIEQRRSVHERFMHDELTCVCATVAFGTTEYVIFLGYSPPCERITFYLICFDSAQEWASTRPRFVA